jgi:hypothetical protein
LHVFALSIDLSFYTVLDEFTSSGACRGKKISETHALCVAAFFFHTAAL